MALCSQPYCTSGRERCTLKVLRTAYCVPHLPCQFGGGAAHGNYCSPQVPPVWRGGSTPVVLAHKRWQLSEDLRRAILAGDSYIIALSCLVRVAYRGTWPSAGDMLCKEV